MPADSPLLSCLGRTRSPPPANCTACPPTLLCSSLFETAQMSASQHAAPAQDLSLKAFMDSVDNLGEAFLHAFAGQGDPPASAKTIKAHFSAWKRTWYLRLVSAPTPRHVTFPGPDPDGGVGWNLLCEADKRTVLSVLQYAQRFLAQHHKLVSRLRSTRQSQLVAHALIRSLHFNWGPLCKCSRCVSPRADLGASIAHC